MIRKTVLALLFVAIALGLFRLVALDKIPCGYVGVRRPQFGPSGADERSVKLLLPGLRFALPIAHQVELISTTVQKIDIEHVEINLKDNLKVFIDASTTFYVEPTELALRFALNDGGQYVRGVMPTDLKGVLREVLQESDADGFLDAAWRNSRKAVIEERLSELLAKRGVTLAQFFLRDFAFASSYERELKYQRQVRQHKHKRSLEIKLAALEAEGDVETQALRAEIDEVGKGVRRCVEAAEYEAELIAEEARQKGEFLVLQAEIEGQRMMSEVLKSANADAMLKMELAEALRTGLKFVILRPSDIGLLDVLGGRSSGTRRSDREE